MIRPGGLFGGAMVRCDAMRRDVDVDVDVVGYIAGLNASWYGGFRRAGALARRGFRHAGL